MSDKEKISTAYGIDLDKKIDNTSVPAPRKRVSNPRTLLNRAVAKEGIPAYDNTRLKEELAQTTHQLEIKTQELEKSQKQIDDLSQKNETSDSVEFEMPISKQKVRFKLLEIEPEQIFVSSVNQRDQSLLSEISVSDIFESIKMHGQTEPGMARPTKDGRYELIMGSRRLFCVRSLGRKYKALVGEVPDIDIQELSNTENAQNPISLYELGCYWSRLLGDGVYSSQRSLAEELGVNLSKVNRGLQLFEKVNKVVIKAFPKPTDISRSVAEWLIKQTNNKDSEKALIGKCEQLLELKAEAAAGGRPYYDEENVRKILKSAVRQDSSLKTSPEYLKRGDKKLVRIGNTVKGQTVLTFLTDEIDIDNVLKIIQSEIDKKKKRK
ncbi:hypothetical protein GCM10023116_15890 [Kistimonas scapharcae]|uniref:ParB-like N-terminal domain-containing protein n=1 Tax=Kistimonas scapharcae TaxID=1036133 RepID=A0ABP8V1X7_9GAMM